MSQYGKSATAKATVGEAQQLAVWHAGPALVAARFAITLSLIACVASAVAIALAVRR
jgi:hypothetical protein